MRPRFSAFGSQTGPNSGQEIVCNRPVTKRAETSIPLPVPGPVTRCLSLALPQRDAC